MQKININFETTIPQRFFIERSMELLHSKTIDSYRLRLHNSYTILEEMVEVVEKLRHHQFKNEYYAKAIAEEIISIVSNDKILLWRSLSKEYLIHLLNDCKNQKEKIYIACQTLLRYNKNYLENAFKSVEDEIDRLSQQAIIYPNDLLILNRLTGDIWTGIRGKGYSKEYLHKLVRALAYKKDNSFENFLLTDITQLKYFEM